MAVVVLAGGVGVVASLVCGASARARLGGCGLVLGGARLSSRVGSFLLFSFLVLFVCVSLVVSGRVRS